MKINLDDEDDIISRWSLSYFHIGTVISYEVLRSISKNLLTNLAHLSRHDTRS